jgi:hypothetical protein
VTYCSSSRLPTKVIDALSAFDRAVGANLTLMIEVLNGRLADNAQNIVRNFEYPSPYFGNVSGLYWDRFTQLKPKANAISSAIREYLKVE